MYDKSGSLSHDEHRKGGNMSRCTRYIPSHGVSASTVPQILRMAQHRLLFAHDDLQPIQGEMSAEGCDFI